MTCVKMLDIYCALLLIHRAAEHAHALVHVVAQHVVGYGGQHRGVYVHLELVLGLRLLQTKGK